MQIKVKKLNPAAVIPKYAKKGDAALDLTATSRESLFGSGMIEYGTGLAVEIPEGYVGLLFPRSSLSKYDLLLSNHVGVVDSGYRGEIKLKFRKLSFTGLGPNYYEIGDRIGQLLVVPYPEIELVESEDLTDTERGAGGFGSSGA